MSITTNGWGSGGVSINGWGSYYEEMLFIPEILYVKMLYGEAYSNVVVRDVLGTSRLQENVLTNRNVDVENIATREKQTISNRSDGWN